MIYAMTDDEIVEHIQELGNQIEVLESKLAKTVRVLNTISVWGEDTYARDLARQLLIEIEEESK